MKNIFLLILLINIFSLNSQAQTTAIPDANFEARLIALGIDSDGLVNGQILNSDAAGVTNLNVYNKNISDLTGISAFTDLIYLECSSNRLTSLNLSSSPNLEVLSCYTNRLTNLNLSNNLTLKRLYCNINHLTNLNLSNNPILETLHCNNNYFTALDLSNNPILEILHCNNNQLTALDISSNPVLKILYCYYTPLTNLNLSNNPTLETLHCYNTPLINLDLSNNPSLETLYCYSTPLINLDLSNNPVLETLHCHDNQLTNLNLSNTPNLQTLNCTDNQLTSLDLSNTPNLQALSCSENQLISLDFSNNPNLQRLECYSNQLTTINTPNNPSLQSVFCYSNQLTNFNTSNTPILEIFHCFDNQLTSLDFSNNPILNWVYCHDNQLTSLNISNNPNLGTLRCHDNLLTNLNTSNTPNLETLNCFSNQLTNLNTSNNPILQTLDCSFNQLTNLDLSNNSLLNHLSIKSNYFNYIYIKNKSLAYFHANDNLSNLVICVDDSITANNIHSYYWSKDSTATYVEICPNTTLIGSAKSDINNNCQVDSLEPIIKNAIIQISSVTDTIYKVTNTSGKYSAELDSGTYTLSITPPNPYLNPCINPQSITVDSLNDLNVVNWALQTTHYCPYLTASISAPLLRMTGGGSAYTIDYCNNGTAPAYGAYIEVELDPFLTVSSTGLPILNQVGNVYTFNLDTLDIDECGSFNINVIVDLSVQIGQVHCSEVHIYPDSLCNNTWTGPIIEANAVCNNDTITFELENIGGSMLAPSNYFVIEDNLVMYTGPFTLGAGFNTTVQIAAQVGKTYRIEAEQATGFPAVLGPHIAYANIQNCNGISTNLNAPLLYYNGNPSPWIDTDCQANVAAYDPNDKTAQQIGYGSQHYIERGTPLDYKVRFQNTGNDTAFHVTILDTISTHLDLSTLQMKTASHNYTWQIVSGNALRIDFPNIKLVDSLTNEPLSHGFFRYEIQQKTNLPLETVINNQAAIYFDYNPPIFTNTTLHTIGENYIPIVLDMKEAWVEEMNVHLYPNPTSGLVYIEQLIGENIQIKVLDNLGRVVLQQKSTDKQTTVDLNRLPQGVYYINIQQEQKISTHKVVKY